MLIDTHAHVNFIGYKDDGDEVVKRALENDIWIINSGSQNETSWRAVEYADRFPEGVYASVGLQPIHLRNVKVREAVGEEVVEFESKEERFDREYYKDLARNKKVVAIGETGLDYSYLEKDEPTEKQRYQDLQKETFSAHLELAKELDKPIVVHCREAHNEVLDMLKKFKADFGYNLRGTIHSFLGRRSQAEQYLAMGFYLSFNGIITFARDYDKVVKNTPLERILLETDCPYLAPVPFRGKRNEPLYVKYVAEKLAELKNVSFEEVARITTENARRLFGI